MFVQCVGCRREAGEGRQAGRRKRLAFDLVWTRRDGWLSERVLCLCSVQGGKRVKVGRYNRRLAFRSRVLSSGSSTQGKACTGQGRQGGGCLDLWRECGKGQKGWGWAIAWG